ncbi:hypothetical protein [Marinobacter nitratireducens]|nr:hypothetical protein [Marinobacter nitratireducens]
MTWIYQEYRGAMKYLLVVTLLSITFLSGCGTYNAKRESYMQDKVYVTKHYFGDAVSEPKFSHYELRADYKVSDDELKVSVDPIEIYTQRKERFAIKKAVSYKRYGPIRYSPTRCVIGVIGVFPVVFALIDNDYADSFKKACNKVYTWEREEKELPPEKAGVEAVSLERRDYRDSDGKLSLQLGVNGKIVNGVFLTGFKGGNRNDAYVWNINNWYDFSQLNNDESLSIKIINDRDGETLVKDLSIKKNESEVLIFKSKYDGVFHLYYYCRLCNANLTDNFYTDQEVLIWRTRSYLYKGDDSLSFVSSCIEDRFDHLRHGNVLVRKASTPKKLMELNSFMYDRYVPVRGVKSPDEPTPDQIRSCIRKKDLDLVIEEY